MAGVGGFVSGCGWKRTQGVWEGGWMGLERWAVWRVRERMCWGTGMVVWVRFEVTVRVRVGVVVCGHGCISAHAYPPPGEAMTEISVG